MQGWRNRFNTNIFDEHTADCALKELNEYLSTFSTIGVVKGKRELKVNPGRKWPKRPPPPDRTARTGQVSRSSISN